MAELFTVEDFVGVEYDFKGNFLKQRASRETRKKRRIDIGRLERQNKITIEFVVASAIEAPSVYEKILKNQGIQQYALDGLGFAYFQNHSDAMQFYLALD
jgi:hypothetical protein